MVVVLAGIVSFRVGTTFLDERPDFTGG